MPLWSSRRGHFLSRERVGAAERMVRQPLQVTQGAGKGDEDGDVLKCRR